MVRQGDGNGHERSAYKYGPRLKKYVSYVKYSKPTKFVRRQGSVWGLESRASP
jgi:hypothetical protein